MAESPSETRTAREFDPRAMSGMADPFPLVNRLREQCPVSYSDAHGGFWNLFTYRDVCAAAVDARTFSSRDNTIPSQNLEVPPPPIMYDPPQHMQFRHPFLKHFSPQVVGELEPAIRAKITNLIDGFIERGEADLVEELYVPFPAFAALQILNLPDEDFPKFARWARMVFSNPNEADGDGNWVGEFFNYAAPLYDQLDGSTGSDIPSVARHIRIDGRDITQTEFVMLLLTFISGGLDTTTNAAGNITVLLHQHPDLRTRLIGQPRLIPSAVEEFLRYITPLPMLARTADHAVTVNSQPIRAGEKVALHWLSANHDPDEFPDPEEVILDRSPNRHLAFGRGPHRCIGMHIARLELRVLLEELLARIPDYEVDLDRVQRLPGITRQIVSLPVRFTPGQAR